MTRNALNGVLGQAAKGEERRSGKRRRYRVGLEHFELIEGLRQRARVQMPLI
jgi:hypothetical protein